MEKMDRRMTLMPKGGGGVGSKKGGNGVRIFMDDIFRH